MADPKDKAAAAKEALAKQNEERKKAIEEADKRMAASKPTPTQEENDLARLGAPPEQKEDDGSGPEPKWVLTRQVEAKPTSSASSGYQTRSTPKPAA